MRFKALLFSILLSASFVLAENPTDFEVKAATSDQTFSLKDAKGKYVALHFLLKTECPVCLRHTQDYWEKADQLPNVLQIFLKPDTDAEIKEWADGLPADELTERPIYRDPEAKLAKEFGVPGGYQFHGQVVHYPATILLDPDGKEVFRYVGKSNRDRLSFEDLAAKVAELSKQ